MKNRYVIPLLTVFTLSGCSVSTYSATDEYEKRTSSHPVNDHWLSTHRDDVTKETVKYIRETHPTTAEWFPRFKIQVVDINTDKIKESSILSLENDLNIIFNNISSQLLPKSSKAETWVVDVNVRFSHKRTGDAAYAAAIPYGLLCFATTLMLVCPYGVTNIAILEASINIPNNKTFNITSYGGSTLYMSTPYMMDATGLEDPSKGKALAAAIADFSNKIVTYVINNHPNKVLNTDSAKIAAPIS